MDDYLEIKFVNEVVGFGVFAIQKIYTNTVLGEYAGLVSFEIEDSTYSWNLNAYYNFGKNNVYVNGLAHGNMLRFINDYGKKNNINV